MRPSILRGSILYKVDAVSGEAEVQSPHARILDELPAARDLCTEGPYG